MTLPHRHRSTPITEPPQDPVETVERRIKPLHAIVAAAVLVFSAGGAVGAIRSKVASTADVEQVRTVTEAHIAAGSAASTAQLGALQSVVQDLRMRQAAVDASLQSLTDDMRFIRSQLIEIARTTGARRVPEPQP